MASYFVRAKCSVLTWYFTPVQPHPPRPHAFMHYGMALFCRNTSKLSFFFLRRRLGRARSNMAERHEQCPYCPWKFSYLWALNSFFWPWRNSPKLCVKQNHCREKEWKHRKNMRVKVPFCKLPKQKRCKKRLSRPNYFSRPKKKRMLDNDAQNNSTCDKN